MLRKVITAIAYEQFVEFSIHKTTIELQSLHATIFDRKIAPHEALYVFGVDVSDGNW